MASENYIMGNHVFVKNGLEAVKFYKEAFNLEIRDELWLDKEGYLVHQELYRDGKLFFSVSDEKHMSETLRKMKCTDGVRPTMLFMVCFDKDEDLRKAYRILCNNEILNSHEVLMDNPDGTVKNAVEVLDKYGVFWWLHAPTDWSKSFIPK